MALAKDPALTFEQGQAWGELQDTMAIRQDRDVLELFDLPIEQLADVWRSMSPVRIQASLQNSVMGLGCATLPDIVSGRLQRCFTIVCVGGTCQQVVSSDPTRRLVSHHGALSRNLAEQD